MTDSQAILVRQPILNLKQQVSAYEMVFRTHTGFVGAGIEPDLHDNTRVIVSSMCHYGLASILGNADGYIYVTPELLLSDTLELLPSQQFILEIASNTQFSEPLLERCQELKEKGFRFAVQSTSPLLEVADVLPLLNIVKIDLSHIPASNLFGVTKSILTRLKIDLLGTAINSEEQYLACKQLGFSLLQGGYFSVPTKIPGRKVYSQQTTLFQIISELFKEGRVSDLEQRFKESPELSVRLLRLVNSVGISGSRVQITNLRQALVTLGQKQLLRWVMLMLYTENEHAASNMFIYRVIQRARFMELLAHNKNFSHTGLEEQAHLVGMLSLTKELLDIPLSELLNEIGLAEHLQAALVHHEGILGQVLKLAIALEDADMKQIESLRIGLGVLTQDISAAHLLAIQWANTLSQKMA